MKHYNGIVLFLIHFISLSPDGWTESVIVIAGGHVLSCPILFLTDRICVGIPLF